MTGPMPPHRRHVEDAIRDLRGLRSHDPAARPAVHAIALTRLTLESFWLDRPNTGERTGERTEERRP